VVNFDKFENIYFKCVEAELARQRIEELREQEIYYRGIALVEKN
jgi:hypothetical protein